MPPYILGVDIGTGSAKTVAVDARGKVFSAEQMHYQTLLPQPGFCEQDPAVILNAFTNIIASAVKNAGTMPAAISLSTAMHSVIAVDEQCKPLTNLILWSDARSAAIVDQIRNSKEAEDIYTCSGTPVHSMAPLYKIIWLKKYLPEVFQKTHKFISVKEYLWYQLFKEFAVDYSLASGTGLFNIDRLQWHENSLAIAGIREKQLSKPVPTNYLRSGIEKHMAEAMNIPSSTSFCIGASDGCLANLGSGSLRRGTAAITIGTSGAVRIASDHPRRNFSTMTFNYILEEKIFICGGPVNNGGNVLQWILKKFMGRTEANGKDYADLFASIEKIPGGSNGLVFLPYLHGERAPVWDDQSSGVFFGIRTEHEQAHFLRAAVEGVCFALKNILTMVETNEEPIQQINVSGGFVHSQLWLQMLADITGKKICLPQNEDASAIGAAYMGLKAVRMISSYESIAQDLSHQILPRDGESSAYENSYRIFKTLYPALKDSMHQINISN